uniref:Uncharacterized protein n=1 Tax=Aegilops tauschii subsp. strangulata TaxID=200361 RepID=A0A453CLH6_AEGTS
MMFLQACLHRWAFGGAGNGGSASFSCRQWKYGPARNIEKFRSNMQIGILAEKVTTVEGSS